MSALYLLYQLQQIDDEIRARKQRLTAVLRARQADDSVAASQARAAATTETLETWRATRRRLDGELNALVDKRRRAESRLYSGQVTNPKELTDLQQSIEGMGRRHAELEDEILEAMIMVEEAEATAVEATTARDAVESAWETEQAALAAEQQELATAVNALTERRQQHVARVPADWLAEYERLAQRRAGVAVVVVKGSTCQSCRVSLPANVVRTAQAGERAHCASCGRLLYVIN